ncbi:hypothetical protein [Vulcanisaeta sp. JCM 16161]
MRLEVLLQLLLAVVFVVTWFFMPAYGIYGRDYSIALMPWGYLVDFFGLNYVAPPPTVFAVWLFALDAGLIPVIWRRTRYPLYLSAFFAVLSLMMLLDTILFQQRYLQVKGYAVFPTPNGYLYVYLLHTSVLGLPTYILLALAILSVFNMATGAKWLDVDVMLIIRRRYVLHRDALSTVELMLRRINIKYVRYDNEIRVGNVALIKDGDNLIIRKDSSTEAVGIENAILELIKAGFSQVITEGTIDYEGE